MRQGLRRLALALSLIVLTSVVLLVSDLDRRSTASSPQQSKKWKIRVVELNQVLDVEETEHGLLAGLREALVEGRDYEIQVSNAQGDMAAVNALVDAAITDGADLLIPLSSPTLQAAIQRAGRVPVVFGYVASGVAAGAGRSDEDHLPNVTGVYFRPEYDDMLSLIRECLPSARTLGTLFVPSEVNSVLHKDLLTERARKMGLEVVAIAASTSTEVGDAALALCSRKIDAICQIPGNMTAAAFSSIAPAAQRARLPVFAFQTSQARDGATAVLARDYEDAGRQTARLAMRVMQGESPAGIPFEPTASKSRLLINQRAARAIGFRFPPAVLARASEVMEEPRGSH